ncbi:MAG: hypothetical protein Q8O98_02810, partial [bacterium]|nr:hypothetical protein [bacterium]
MGLDEPLHDFFRILPAQVGGLKKLCITSARDLLYHFPVRYNDTAEISAIANLAKDERAVIFGKISGLKSTKAFYKKIPLSEAVVEDETGKIKIVWFHQA